MRSAVVWAGVAVALIAVACGRATPPERERVIACEILHRRDVARVLGGPVHEPATSADAATDTLAGRSGCAWSRRDGSRAVLVELVRTRDMSSSVRRTGFSAAARFGAVAEEHPDAERVTDVGDRALYVEPAATLHVLVGSSYVTFEVAATPPSEIRPAAVRLARQAVVRLQQLDAPD